MQKDHWIYNVGGVNPEFNNGVYGTIEARLLIIKNNSILGTKSERKAYERLKEGTGEAQPVDGFEANPSSILPTKNPHTNFKQITFSEFQADRISIINLDKKTSDPNKPYIHEEIILPFIPKEVEVRPESRFASIPTIGRNLNYYHYTGSEKIIEFEIDWYAFDNERVSVIENCRKIEALSMADGFKKDPPRVKLQWGNEDSLFSDSIWVVLKAPYRLLNFSNATIVGNGKYLKNSLLPIQAYQTVTLGKVSAYNVGDKQKYQNLSWDQITGETNKNHLDKNLYTY